jgi:hypothetical protein
VLNMLAGGSDEKETLGSSAGKKKPNVRSSTSNLPLHCVPAGQSADFKEALGRLATYSALMVGCLRTACDLAAWFAGRFPCTSVCRFLAASEMQCLALTTGGRAQAVQEVFGSDVESDFEQELAPAEKISRKRAADGEPKRPPAKRKSRSRTVFGVCPSQLCCFSRSCPNHLCLQVDTSVCDCAVRVRSSTS